MSLVNINVVVPWQIRKPAAVRYLPEVYVDEFFKDGTLRLPSFRAFRQHKEEQRLDTNEGMTYLEAPPGDGTATLVVAPLHPRLIAWVLSTSTIESATLRDTFQVDSGFRITNVMQFAVYIARHLPGCTHGIQGICDYRELPSLMVHHRDTFDMPHFGETAEEHHWRMERLRAPHQYSALLVKHLQYASQSEYRIVWFCMGSNPDNHITIHCPEARDYCQKLEPRASPTSPVNSDSTS
ncbi:MAG: hypothetical protein H6825_16730 [Planctomycetes bacterium]|nr:hypothetical protein [Planctomycetota bacterium]